MDEIRFKFLSDSVLKAFPFSIFNFRFAIGRRFPVGWMIRQIRNPISKISKIPNWRIGSGTKLEANAFSICDFRSAIRRRSRHAGTSDGPGGGRVLPVPAAGAQGNGVGYFYTSGELC